LCLKENTDLAHRFISITVSAICIDASQRLGLDIKIVCKNITGPF